MPRGPSQLIRELYTQGLTDAIHSGSRQQVGSLQETRQPHGRHRIRPESVDRIATGQRDRPWPLVQLRSHTLSPTYSVEKKVASSARKVSIVCSTLHTNHRVFGG